jgi:hypothetical protein
MEICVELQEISLKTANFSPVSRDGSLNCSFPIPEVMVKTP